MAIPYCSQADLEVALGGAAILAQLADPDRSGVPNTALIQDYLESGAARIRSAVEIKHDPEVISNMDGDSLRRLRDCNASLSAREAYWKGGLGQAMPDWIRERADSDDRYCDDLAKGNRRLGRVAGGKSAAINQVAAIVDFDPDATGISIAAMQRGFR